MSHRKLIRPTGFSRRAILQSGAALAATGLLLPRTARAQEPLRVASIYTVPVEQQWVSRIHKAAEAAVAAGEIS